MKSWHIFIVCTLFVIVTMFYIYKRFDYDAGYQIFLDFREDKTTRHIASATFDSHFFATDPDALDFLSKMIRGGIPSSIPNVSSELLNSVYSCQGNRAELGLNFDDGSTCKGIFLEFSECVPCFVFYRGVSWEGDNPLFYFPVLKESVPDSIWQFFSNYNKNHE